MQITEISTIDKKKALVHLDDGRTYPMYMGEIRNMSLREGSEISDDTCGIIEREILLKRGKERAMYMLQGADRTEYQIREKLRKGHYPRHIIQQVIDFLKKYEYVDDYGYAAGYVQSYGSCKSRRMIVEKLKAKGISKDIIEQALDDELSDSGYNPEKIIMDFLVKKNYHLKCDDLKEKNKIMGCLLRKGFSYGDISDAMTKAEKSAVIN